MRKKLLLLSLLGTLLLSGAIFQKAHAQCLTIVDTSMTLTGYPNHWNIYVKWAPPVGCRRLLIYVNGSVSRCIDLLADSSYTFFSVPAVGTPVVTFVAFVNNSCADNEPTCPVLVASGARLGTEIKRSTISLIGGGNVLVRGIPLNTTVSVWSMQGIRLFSKQATSENFIFSLVNFSRGQYYIVSWVGKDGKANSQPFYSF